MWKKWHTHQQRLLVWVSHLHMYVYLIMYWAAIRIRSITFLNSNFDGDELMIREAWDQYFCSILYLFHHEWSLPYADWSSLHHYNSLLLPWYRSVDGDIPSWVLHHHHDSSNTHPPRQLYIHCVFTVYTVYTVNSDMEQRVAPALDGLVSPLPSPLSSI